VAIPEKEFRTVLKAVGAFIEKKRPPERLRSRVDLRASIGLSDVVISIWRDDDAGVRETPVARMRWFNSRKIWRLFWRHDDGTWKAYEPYPEASRIATHLRTIEEDSLYLLGEPGSGNA